LKLLNAVTGKVPERRPPSLVIKALAILDKLPDGHYLTSRQLGDILGVGPSAIVNHYREPAFLPYLAQSPEHHAGKALCNKKTAKHIRESKP
jgi:hypothetical protein